MPGRGARAMPNSVVRASRRMVIGVCYTPVAAVGPAGEPRKSVAPRRLVGIVGEDMDEPTPPPDDVVAPAGAARALDTVGWLGPWVAVAALGFWTSAARSPLLLLAAVGATLGLFAARSRN